LREESGDVGGLVGASQSEAIEGFFVGSNQVVKRASVLRAANLESSVVELQEADMVRDLFLSGHCFSVVGWRILAVSMG
jgi:hypothetical protein